MSTFGNDTPQRERRARAASKAYIIRGDCGLILHKPEAAARFSLSPEAQIDVPGGRLEFGESFEEGLLREIDEETQLTVRIVAPFDTWSLARDDIQVLGVDYLCLWERGEVVLSEEHVGFEWLTLDEIAERGWRIETSFRKAFALLETMRAGGAL